MSPRILHLRRHLLVLRCLLPSVTLAGCAVGPAYHAPDAGPVGAFTALDAVSAESPPPDWWRALGDASLDWVVGTALRDNPNLARAEALVRRARAAVGIAGGAMQPALSAGARVSDDKLSRNGENLALIPVTPRRTEFTDHRIGLDASWELDLAGGQRRELEAALARYGSAQESRNDARVVLAGEVASQYVQLRIAQQRRGVAAERLARATEARRLVSLARDAGVVGDDDLRHADADVESAAAQVPPLEAAAASSLQSLAALCGIDAAEVDRHLGGSSPVPAVPVVVPVGLSTDVLRRRPDVRVAERELAASTAEVGGAMAAQYPRLVLVADGGLDSVRSGDLGAAASRYWNLAPQLSLPLWAGGRLRAQVRAAEAARDAAVATYRARVLGAFADSESAIVRYGAARTRLAAVRRAAEVLASPVASARQRLGVGDGSQLDVLAAERAADDARDQVVQAEGDVALAYVALNRALGGGWQVTR